MLYVKIKKVGSDRCSSINRKRAFRRCLSKLQVESPGYPRDKPHSCNQLPVTNNHFPHRHHRCYLLHRWRVDQLGSHQPTHLNLP